MIALLETLKCHTQQLQKYLLMRTFILSSDFHSQNTAVIKGQPAVSLRSDTSLRKANTFTIGYRKSLFFTSIVMPISVINAFPNFFSLLDQKN